MDRDNFILTDGFKAASLLLSDDPSVWTFLSHAPVTDSDRLFSRVAAAYRAYQLKANTVGNMPFALMRGKTEFDTSATWENKIGFLPNPSELFRLATLSYMASNTIYHLRTADALGYKTKGLYHAIPYSFRPVTDSVSGQLLYIERKVGTGMEVERYKPEDKRLVRMWRLDHTTEILPSPHTEAAAIMNAAGVAYHADSWIMHFFSRGGIAPTVIGMKGALPPDRVKGEEKSWRDWILGLGARFRSNPVRVANAEALDVQQFGSSVTDLKDNEVYTQALANIAMGTGMPLSLLMANSANYATAKEEKATWLENDIIPLVMWLAYEYNRQVFEPLGLRLEFRPETMDPQQEDETERAAAMLQYANVLEKCPSKDVFMGLASTLGLEISDDLEAALDKYYAEKEQREKEMQEQMAQGGYVTGPDGKPIPAQVQDKPKDDDRDDKRPQRRPFPPQRKTWTPSLAEVKEISVWCDVALRRLKRGESLDFEYTPHYGGLPEDVTAGIRSRLAGAASADEVRAAFELEQEPGEPVAEYGDDALKALAQAINNMADKYAMGIPVPTT